MLNVIVLSVYKIISLYRPQVFVCVREWKNDKAVIMPTKIMSFVVLMENCGNAKSSRGGEVGTLATDGAFRKLVVSQSLKI